MFSVVDLRYRVRLQGAFWGLMIGLTVGVVRMVLDFVYPEPGCGQVDLRPLIVSRVHYMYFALLLFLLTCITVVLFSYAGKQPDPSRVGILLTVSGLNIISSSSSSYLFLS